MERLKSNPVVVALVILILGSVIIYAVYQPGDFPSGDTLTFGDVPWKSEVRGVFTKDTNDFELLAQTCTSYNVSWVVYEAFGTYFARYPSSVIAGTTRDYIREGIDACHKYGIKFYAMMLCCFGGSWANLGDMKVVMSNGQTGDWVCPNRASSKQRTRLMVEEVASRYPDLDGFMYDYIRYDTADMCFCDQCRDRFKTDTGKTDTVWPTDVIPGGRYRTDFLYWRHVVVTDYAKSIHNWMSTINPNLEFGIASFTLFQDSGSYWRYWIAQDTAEMIKEGCVDSISPMMYTANLGTPDGITDYIKSNRHYLEGGPDNIAGSTQFLPFIADGSLNTITVPQFQGIISKVRELGANGWIVYMYGGPGSPNTVDIRTYLSSIDYPTAFSITNIKVVKNSNTASVSWSTDVATTGKVEYGLSSFFTWGTTTSYGIPCSILTYSPGTIIPDSSAFQHSIELPVVKGTRYYFRVQSTNGYMLTSSVYSFVF